jgi:hypothetical protein
LLDERNGIIEKYQVRELSPARSLSLALLHRHADAMLIWPVA